MRLATRLAGAIVALCMALAAHAQSSPERTAAIAAAAKREGTLTLYSSMAEKDLLRLVADFERRYGIHVNVWRSGKNKVLQRTITEARSGRHDVDVIHNPSPEMEALHREKLLERVDSPWFATLIPEAVAPHHEWAGPRVYLFVQAYNTQKVKREELPRTWQDLLDPRWKGRLGAEGKALEWFYTIVHAMGEDKGLAFFRKLAATNGLSVRLGNALVDNLVVAGEMPFVLAIYSYLPEQSKRAGAPIDWIALPPTIAATDAIGIAAHAPHPNAALLFYEYMLSDGQALMAKMNQVVSSRSNAAQIERLHPVFIDPAAIIVDYDRWTRLYDATIRAQAP